MTLQTQRELIRFVAKRWKGQYCRCGEWSTTPVFSRVLGRGPIGKDKEEIWRKLSALNLETASAQEVNEIIGNDSWTRMECDECRQPATALVSVGDDPEQYDGSTARICRSCIARAAAIEWPTE